jgi:hypothetical protein
MQKLAYGVNYYGSEEMNYMPEFLQQLLLCVCVGVATQNSCWDKSLDLRDFEIGDNTQQTPLAQMQLGHKRS